jgi:hypothetical protein
MDSTLSFRFAEDDLNRRLISLLKKTGLRHFVDENGVIHYSREDEERVENDLICSIRKSVFTSWQVLTCPKEWTERYKTYMTQRDIPFKEELSNGQKWFLLPQKYRPHRWQLEKQAATVRD